MFKKTRSLAGVVLLWAVVMAPSAAHEGHDHDAEPAAAAAAATVPSLHPRFVAQSAQFEMVGIADGKQITVYLDRFDSNAPVAAARVDLEVGGAKVQLEKHGDGEFEGVLAEPLKPGHTPVKATVTAGAETDALEGEFDWHAEEAHADGPSEPRWKRYGAWAVAAVAALALAGFMARRAQARRDRVGGAA